MTGFDRQLRDKILGFQAHLKISMARSNLRI
jgi:ABC-type lipoprotein release transport system permease subunit